MTAPAFHLSGTVAPVLDEVTATDLALTAPRRRARVGRFVRNGPSSHAASSPHWSRHGMRHGVELRFDQPHDPAVVLGPAPRCRDERGLAGLAPPVPVGVHGPGIADD